ncbi:transcriptional regulator, GntR family [Rhizobium sp. RU35A]|uniref:Histidine utilization repressor n=1 Tax=Rhizobium straminoryzae TaxID=1387186 RepID=A0A549SW14_9HYPH|nr:MULTISPECIES: histidine utilization repressor [Rhizobium]TRL33810.1 histidine utilization repressor [Rhizobium straminoryzae]SIQ87362.1 transcriptional regulator, GntR family [Rhizobium sp. RU35A]
MNTDKEKTLHGRILGDLERRILSGEWPPGYRLPFEVDLAIQYGCSRMTANKVLTQLARAGLIERRKKSGSFVAQPVAQSAVLEIHDIETEVRSLNLSYGYRLETRNRRMATRQDCTLMELADGSAVLECVAVHLAGGRPFCLEYRLINLATVPEAESEDFSLIAPGAFLISRVPWNAAEHRIQAVTAAADVATKLEIARHSACLVIERRTWGAGGPVTFVRFTYPGDRHALVARFQPGG